MKATLVKEDGLFYLISKDEIKSGDEYIKLNRGRVKLLGVEGVKCTRVYNLSLENCEAIERGYDLDELVDEIYPKPENSILPIIRMNAANRAAFYSGFQKSLEILGDKSFTKQDIKDSIIFGQGMELWEEEDQIEKWIKSLKQTEWEVEIEMEDSKIADKHEWDGSNNGELTWVKQPKLDKNGFLILKRV